MYTVIVMREGMLVDIFTCVTFEDVTAFARLYWSASPLNSVTWSKE